MKKIMVVLLIAGGLYPCLSIAQDAETLKKALPDGFAVISINQEAVPLSAEVRGPDGQVTTVYLIKDGSGQWVASSNPNYYRAPGDVFVQSEQQDDARIKTDQEKMHSLYEEQQRDQDIADDVNADR
ncbi:MAG: hypothetical protein V1789_11160 [PVC group bacterium]